MCLPDGSRRIRLLSRRWVPAESRAEAHDTRKLGIALSRIWRDGREASLDSPALTDGWHGPERHVRWTDGDAAVAVDGARTLAFEVAMAGRYWCRPADAALRVSARRGP